MTPVELYLDGIVFRGGGIEDWQSLRGYFGEDAGPCAADEKVVPDCLSPRAARRVSPQIRLALYVAERVAASLPDDASWVFASSVGEGETLQVILEALREPDMLIQPLRFQNAVHNAAAGQWSIAAGITRPFTSIAAHDETVGAGFLKAGIQVFLESRAAGLVFYDVPMPEPLNAKRPLGVPLGAGFALSTAATPETVARIDVSLSDKPPTPPERQVSRRLIETGNPVARVLPLLERIAAGSPGNVYLGLHGGATLRLEVTPL